MYYDYSKQDVKYTPKRNEKGSQFEKVLHSR